MSNFFVVSTADVCLARVVACVGVFLLLRPLFLLPLRLRLLLLPLLSIDLSVMRWSVCKMRGMTVRVSWQTTLVSTITVIVLLVTSAFVAHYGFPDRRSEVDSSARPFGVVARNT